MAVKNTGVKDKDTGDTGVGVKNTGVTDTGVTDTGVKIEDPSNYTDIGRQAFEKASKHTDETVEVRELSKEMNKDYMTTLVDTALKGKEKHTGNYFVVVLTKVERLISKTLRNYFFTRQSCPTPNCDQTVYMFNPVTEDLTFLWVIPSKRLCKKIYLQKYSIGLHKNELLPFVVDYMEGKLLSRARELNNEIGLETSLA